MNNLASAKKNYRGHHFAKRCVTEWFKKRDETIRKNQHNLIWKKGGPVSRLSRRHSSHGGSGKERWMLSGAVYGRQRRAQDTITNEGDWVRIQEKKRGGG